MVADMEHNAKNYREKGNECVKNEKYMEAVLHYTFAIKLDLRNAELYSNRSLAFLKSSQLHYALEDAEQVIKFRPKWPKGYFRKAEVLSAAQHYEAALDSYQRALQLQPDDSSVFISIEKTKKAMKELKRKEAQMPWLGSAFGIVFGIFAVVFEYSVLENRLLAHPFLQVFVILLVAVSGYAISCVYRNYLKSYKDSMLEKPIDLFGDSDHNKKD